MKEPTVINGLWIIIPVIIFFVIGIIKEVVRFTMHIRMEKEGTIEKCDCFDCIEFRAQKNKKL